jgi:hypothetical protein
MTEGDTDAQPLSPSATTIVPRHVGRRSGFFDEDEPVRIKVELTFEPRLSTFRDIGTILFRRVTSFLRVIP